MNLFVFLIIVWTVITWYVSAKVYHTAINPCNCMNFVWTVCVFLSQFGIYNFNVPNTKTYMYIWIMLIFFSTASMIFFLCTTYNGEGDKIIRFDAYKWFNVNNLWVILIGCIIYLMPVFSKVMPYVMSGDFDYIRFQVLAGVNGEFFSYLQFYVYVYIIRPFFVSLSIIAAYAVAINHSQKKVLLLQGIIGGVIHMFVYAGRKEIFNYIVFIACACLLSKTGRKKKEKRGKKNRIFLYMVMVLSVVFIVYMTSRRLHFGQDIMQTFYQYMIGPMCYLNLIVNNYSQFGIFSENYLFGEATLGFITGPIHMIIACMGGDYQGVDYILSKYIDTYYYISSTSKLNATSTIIYAFLRDFGTAGLVAGSILFAGVVNVVLYMAVSRNTVRWNCVLIMFYFVLIFSVWRYSLIFSDFYMAILWIFVISGRQFNIRVKFKF